MRDSQEHVMTTIGDRIKERRQFLHWTLEQLAKEAQVSKGFLSDLENGRRKNAGGNYLKQIARALGVSLDFLISGGTPASQDQPIQIPASLAAFAKQENLPFSVVVMLLQFRHQIVAFRSESKSGDLEDFDWKRFYEALKPHLK